MSEDPGRAVWLPQARSYLRDGDPVLARLIDDRPDFDPRAWMDQLPPMDLSGALLRRGPLGQQPTPSPAHAGVTTAQAETSQERVP